MDDSSVFGVLFYDVTLGVVDSRWRIATLYNLNVSERMMFNVEVFQTSNDMSIAVNRIATLVWRA